MADSYSSFSLINFALTRKYAKGAGEAAVREAVAQSKLYTDEQVGKILSFNIEIVQTLPVNPDTHTIYLVPKTLYSPNNGYFEYIYLDGNWELIGDTEVDLTDYYTKDEVDNLIEANKYELPPATANKLGGIMVDSNTLLINSLGLLSVKESGTVDTINKVIQPIDNDDINSLFN